MYSEALTDTKVESRQMQLYIRAKKRRVYNFLDFRNSSRDFFAVPLEFCVIRTFFIIANIISLDRRSTFILYRSNSAFIFPELLIIFLTPLLYFSTRYNEWQSFFQQSYKFDSLIVVYNCGNRLLSRFSRYFFFFVIKNMFLNISQKRLIFLRFLSAAINYIIQSAVTLRALQNC